MHDVAPVLSMGPAPIHRGGGRARSHQSAESVAGGIWIAAIFRQGSRKMKVVLEKQSAERERLVMVLGLERPFSN